MLSADYLQAKKACPASDRRSSAEQAREVILATMEKPAELVSPERPAIPAAKAIVATIADDARTVFPGPKETPACQVCPAIPDRPVLKASKASLVRKA
jgi:hypothetical protein